MHRPLIILFSLCVCVICELINKHEGSKCRWRGASGTCVLISKCQSAMDYMKTRDYPPICTFQGKEPVICCTDCSFVDDIRKMIFNPHLGILNLNGNKAHDKCINFIDKLDYECKVNKTAEITHTLNTKKNCYVVEEKRNDGSMTPTVDEVPFSTPFYLALLGYGADMKTGQWLCAGTIISEKYILTAAHCIINDKLGLVHFVAVDLVKRTDPADLWQKHTVKRTFSHPDYNPPSLYHDIGLVETETTITFGQNVRPACPLSENFGSSFAYTVVWDWWGEDQGTLKLAELSYSDDTQCSFLYPPQENLANGFNYTTQICKGNKAQPEDSCQSTAEIGKRKECACRFPRSVAKWFDSNGSMARVPHAAPLAAARRLPEIAEWSEAHEQTCNQTHYCF